jgi:hypothetical protein
MTFKVKQVHPETGEAVEIEFTVKLLFPTDMSCHWSTSQAGGGAGGPDAKPCHKCNCTKADLGKCFERFQVKKKIRLLVSPLGLATPQTF